MNWRTTAALLVVFAVLLGYLFFWEKPQQASVTPTPSAEYLWTIDSSDVKGLRVVDHVSGQRVAFGQDDLGHWTVTEPQPGEADQTQAAVDSYQVQNLRIIQKMTETTDLAQFGVQSPSYTLEVTTGSQGTLVARIGGKSPMGNGYYVVRPGEVNAVLVSASAIDALIGLVDRPPYASTATPASAETPTAVDASSVTETPDTYGAATPTASATATP